MAIKVTAHAAALVLRRGWFLTHHQGSSCVLAVLHKSLACSTLGGSVQPSHARVSSLASVRSSMHDIPITRRLNVA